MVHSKDVHQQQVSVPAGRLGCTVTAGVTNKQNITDFRSISNIA